MNETIGIFKNDLNCQMDENVMTNEPALSTQVKNINTFLKGKGKVPCI